MVTDYDLVDGAGLLVSCSNSSIANGDGIYEPNTYFTARNVRITNAGDITLPPDQVALAKKHR
jgi:hypothetical protein